MSGVIGARVRRADGGPRSPAARSTASTASSRGCCTRGCCARRWPPGRIIRLDTVARDGAAGRPRGRHRGGHRGTVGHVHQGPAAARRRHRPLHRRAGRRRGGGHAGGRRRGARGDRARDRAARLPSPSPRRRSPRARRSSTPTGGPTAPSSKASATATGCGRPSWRAATSQPRSRATTSSWSRTSSACPASTSRYIEPRCAVARFETVPLRDPHLDAVPGPRARPDCRGAWRARARRCGSSPTRSAAASAASSTPGPSPTPRFSPQRAKRPVKLVYTRGEEFVAATMRENAIVRLRSAVTRHGEIVGPGGGVADGRRRLRRRDARDRRRRDADRGVTYRVRAVRYRGHAVYTNTPPTGSFRGVCGPYMVFAAERHMDRIAARARHRPARAARCATPTGPATGCPTARSFATPPSRRPSSASRQSRRGPR